MHRKVEHFGPLPLWPFLEHWNWNMEHYQSSSTIFRLYTIVYNNNYTTINKLEYIPKVEVPCVCCVCYVLRVTVPLCLSACMPGCLDACIQSHTVQYTCTTINKLEYKFQKLRCHVLCTTIVPFCLDASMQYICMQCGVVCGGTLHSKRAL